MYPRSRPARCQMEHPVARWHQYPSKNHNPAACISLYCHYILEMEGPLTEPYICEVGQIFVPFVACSRLPFKFRRIGLEMLQYRVSGPYFIVSYVKIISLVEYSKHCNGSFATTDGIFSPWLVIHPRATIDHIISHSNKSASVRRVYFCQIA
jgi:hypothetical protein